jgi:diacylglycerol kinase family enzyme
MDDGLLDVVIIPDLTKRELLWKLPGFYGGAHLDDPAVRCLQGRCLEAEAAPGEVPTEIDGEPLGALPARYEILPRAITLVGADA